jgi:hypothetical protein
LQHGLVQTQISKDTLEFAILGFQQLKLSEHLWLQAAILLTPLVKSLSLMPILRQKREEYELIKAEFELFQKGQFQVCLRQSTN